MLVSPRIDNGGWLELEWGGTCRGCGGFQLCTNDKRANHDLGPSVAMFLSRQSHLKVSAATCQP
jgi:hypothetical protein